MLYNLHLNMHYFHINSIFAACKLILGMILKKPVMYISLVNNCIFGIIKYHICANVCVCFRYRFRLEKDLSITGLTLEWTHYENGPLVKTTTM